MSGEEDMVHEEVHGIDRVPVKILGQGCCERAWTRELHLRFNLNDCVDQTFEVHIRGRGEEMEYVGNADELVDTFIVVER